VSATAAIGKLEREHFSDLDRWRPICFYRPQEAETTMRLLIFVTAASVSVGACNRDVATAAAARASDSGAPVATAGIGEAASATPVAERAAVRDVTIPAGTTLPIVLDTSVGSETSRVEEPVHAHLSRAIVIRGITAVPQGSRVSGIVTDATRSGKVKGRAHVALRFETLAPANDGERYSIRTTAVGRTAEATKEKDALEIGAPAAGGAIIGAIVGGKKGALIGTAVGGGAGTAVVLSTRGKEVHLPKGTALMLKLTEPVTVKVKG
jgi:hypothetical protein